MGKRCFSMAVGVALAALIASATAAQDKKVERLRVGGGSASGTQLSMWLAKEGNFYEKHGLNVEAQSTSPAAPSAYQAALSALPSVEKVEVRDQRARDNVMTFTMAVTFRPETIRPTPATP